MIYKDIFPYVTKEQSCYTKMRKTIEIDPPRRKEMYQLIKGVYNRDKRDAALFSIFYLTGARVSEIVKLMKKKDWNFDESEEYVVVKVFNEKRKVGIKIRNTPIRKNDEFMWFVNDYLKSIKDENEIMFPFTRQTAWRRLKKYDDRLWPHLFRHSRFTEVATKLTDQELAQFAGWTDSRPSKNYIHLRWEDIAKKI